MKTLSRISIMALIMMLVAFTVTSSATTYTVGVKIGSRAKYTTYGVWQVEPSDANVTPSQLVKDADYTEWIEFEVLEISLTSITISAATRFKNGTQRAYIFSGDVKTGDGNLSFFVVAAGLNVEDRVSEAQYTFSINETTSKFYAGAWREVNYASMSLPLGEEAISADEYYWDKETGILCGASISRYEQTESYKTLASVITEITETNAWGQSSGFGLLEWGLIIVAITGVSVFFLFRRRSGKKGRRRKR